MKLLAKIIGENLIVGVDTFAWDSIDTPFLFTKELVDGYSDISSIENIDMLAPIDYSRKRDEIIPLFYAEAGSQLQNFASMSTAKKVLACKYFLIPYSLRLQIVGENVDDFNWKHLLSESKKSRSECVESMRLYVGSLIRTSVLSLVQTKEFFIDVSEMIYQFEEANISNFKEFIFSTGNYVGEFEAKNYYSTEIQNKLIDIYNGNY